MTIEITGGSQRGGKTAALLELAREWLEARPGSFVWWYGRRISGREVRRGLMPAPGWRLEKEDYRDAYLAFPWLIYHARRLERRYRWALHEWALDRGILEIADGGYYQDARIRGWCALFGHEGRAALEYRTAAGAEWLKMPRWCTIAAGAWLAGPIVLTHARQWCDRCGRRWDYELRPAIVVTVPLPEPALDADALEGWLPELHAPPFP